MAGGVPAGRLSIELVAEIARLQQDLDKAKRLVNAASGDIAKSARAANDNLAAIGGGMAKAGNNGRLASHHIQNLAFQFQDLGVQIASGSNPLIAFIQQGSQISGVLAQAGVGVGGMIKQLGGMTLGFLAAHPALVAVAVAAGAGTLAFKGFADTLEDKAPVDDYIKSLGLTADEAKKLEDAHVTLGDAAGAAWDMIKEGLGLEDVFSTLKGWVSDAAQWLYGTFKSAASGIYAYYKTVFDNIGLIFQNLPALAADAITLYINKTLAGWETMINAAARGLNWLTGSNIGTINLPRLDREYSAAGKSLAKSFSTNYAAGLKGFDEWEDRTIGRRNARLKAQAADIIKDRKDKSSKAANDAANEAAKLAKWVEDTRAQAQGNVWKLAQEMESRQREWGKDEVTLAEQMIQQAKDLGALEEERARGARDVLDIYLQQLDALGRMGGVFGPLAGVLTGLKTGNFSGVGGKVGGLLGLPTGGTTKDIDGRVIAETLGDKLKEVFGKNGEFFQNFSSILANAAIGSTTAGLAGGNKLGGAIGGAIGGKLGKDLLTKPLTDAFGKTLGGLAGPLGSIAGGLLGGVVGGLFKPAPKYGTSRLYMDEYGQLTGTKAKGNDAAAQRAATSLAGGVGKGLMSIAETLGAKITNVPTNIVLGTFDGKYRVNTEGRGGKMDFKGNSAKGLHNFGDDQQAAIEFAIQKSIEGAVLSGISQASINILKSGQDLQKAIEKATMIEDIPKELQRRFDPVGYAIDELNRKWEKTVGALREGGATAQQMADAQKLYNLELIDAKENASSASQTLKDFLKSMNMGANSPLSLRDQAMSAKAALDPFLAQINAGQAINQDKYLEAAQTYLDIERQMYGSTAKYFEAFDAIQAATNKAIATVDNAAPIRTTADPFIEQAASATKATAAAAENTAANTANANILLGKLEGKLDQVIAALKENGGTWTGSLRNYG